ncbi:MAG: flagellar biosynthetic protein FliR [Actinobacteria bacterium]|nr:flagellar biosynthetic protein FliR [Actinomycetota bacterium]
MTIETLDRNTLVGFILVLARVAPLFLLAPPFSSSMVPVRARVIVAVAVAIGLAPLALHGQAIPADAVTIVELILKEIVIGLAFAMAIASLFAGVNAAGAMIDTQMGLNFGSLINPVDNTQSGTMSQLYAMVGILVFIVIDGEAWVIRGLSRTYELVPMLEMPSIARMTAAVSSAFAGIFTAALEVAAPVLLALILTDVAFGVVSRVVPQLNVFAVGFPAKIIVGLLVVAAALPFLGTWFYDQLQHSVETGLSGIGVG